MDIDPTIMVVKPRTIAFMIVIGARIHQHGPSRFVDVAGSVATCHLVIPLLVAPTRSLLEICLAPKSPPPNSAAMAHVELAALILVM